MKSDNSLPQLYEQWRILSEAEREAIRCSDWIRLTKSQAEKQRLQQRILQATEVANRGAIAPADDAALQALGRRLISLEKENAQALAEKRRGVEKQQRELAQTSRNLQRVHRAYAQGRQPAWQSYS